MFWSRFLRLLLLLLPLTNWMTMVTSVECHFQFTFINPDHSAVKLRSSFWKNGATDNNNQGEHLWNPIEFHVKANSEDGTVLTILNKQDEELQVRIISGYFIVTSSKNKSLHSVLSPVVADGWNSIVLAPNKDDLLKLTVNSKTFLTVVNDTKTRWSLQHWKDVWIGAYDGGRGDGADHSFIGCLMINKTIKLGMKDVSHVIERRSLVLDDCVSACEMQTCQNGGRCINNFRNVMCDCVGTGYEGDSCERVAPHISMKRREVIKLRTMEETSSTPIRKVVFRFKTQQPDGVIFYSNLHKEIITIQLKNNMLFVKLLKKNKESYTTTIGKNLHDGHWHLVSLVIAYNGDGFSVSVDTESENEIIKLSGGGGAGKEPTSNSDGGGAGKESTSNSSGGDAGKESTSNSGGGDAGKESTSNFGGGDASRRKTTTIPGDPIESNSGPGGDNAKTNSVSDTIESNTNTKQEAVGRHKEFINLGGGLITDEDDDVGDYKDFAGSLQQIFINGQNVIRSLKLIGDKTIFE